jgi:hypothetical protein
MMEVGRELDVEEGVAVRGPGEHEFDGTRCDGRLLRDGR